MASSNPWVLDRDPWDGNPSQFNHEPCVDVGSDQSADVTDALSISAFVQDDGSTSVTWTQESGPGSVSFGSTSKKSTTAQFSAPGAGVQGVEPR